MFSVEVQRIKCVLNLLCHVLIMDSWSELWFSENFMEGNY